MAALHIVHSVDALASCLELAEDQDAVLLLGEAARLGREDYLRPVLVLEDVFPAEIPYGDQVSATDYPGFVDLVIRHQPIITWR